MNNIVIFSDYVYNTSVMSKLLGDIAEDALFPTCAFTDKQGNTTSGNDGNAYIIPYYGGNNFS